MHRYSVNSRTPSNTHPCYTVESRCVSLPASSSISIFFILCSSSSVSMHSNLTSPSLVSLATASSPRLLLLFWYLGSSASTVQAAPWTIDTLAVAVTVVTCLPIWGESDNEEDDEEEELLLKGND